MELRKKSFATQHAMVFFAQFAKTLKCLLQDMRGNSYGCDVIHVLHVILKLQATHGPFRAQESAHLDIWLCRAADPWA